MRVLNRQQMQEADRTTIDGGVSSIALMARAGKAAAATIVQRFGPRAHGRISCNIARIATGESWHSTH